MLLIVFAVLIVPAICLQLLMRSDMEPSMQFLAMVVLAPILHFLILVLRRNL